MATERDPAAEADLKVQEKQTVEKRQELLKSLQNQVDEVDRNVTNWAKSFDSLYEHLCNRSEELGHDIASRNQDKDEGDTEILSKTQEHVSHLLQRAKTVAEDKEKAIWSLSKLIHFIHADREEICTNEALERCKALDMDAYLKNNCLSSNENGETLVELLEEQNKRLQEKYKLAREHVKIVSEREKIVNDDRYLLREKLKKQDPKLKEFDNDYFAMPSLPDKSEGDVDEGSYSYNRKDAECVTSPPPYGSDVFASTRGMRSSDIDNDRENHAYTELQSSELLRVRDELKEQITRRGVDREVQTIDPEETSSDESENQMADQRIAELQSELQSVHDRLKDKEQLLLSVVCRDFYEVTMVHHNANRIQKIELDLITEMNKAMEKLKYGLHIRKASFPRIADQEQVIIMTCIREPRNRSWETTLSFAAASDSVTSRMLLVVFYDLYDKADLEQALIRKCDALEKYGRVLTLRCSNGYLYSKEKEIQDIVKFLMAKVNGQREVVACCNCKKQSSFY